MNLSTTYLGLKLRTPLVPSASPLSQSVDNLKRMEDAGASAVVLHSLFEEQIRAERGPRKDGWHVPDATFPEAQDFTVGPDEYLNDLVRAKEHLQIPVIASLNGTTFGGWTTFSRQIEQAGADALELNFYTVPTDAGQSAEEIEHYYLTIVMAIKAMVRIPVAVKLSPYFTNLNHFVQRLERHGADGVVLFNRFYQPDIDLETRTVITHAQLTTSSALRLPLRWIGIFYRKMHLSLAATGGVHRGEDALKLLLAGADVTMLCSALMRHGIDHLRAVEREMTEWMERHGYDEIIQFQGQASRQESADPAAFERAQYVRAVGAFRTPTISKSASGIVPP